MRTPGPGLRWVPVNPLPPVSASQPAQPIIPAVPADVLGLGAEPAWVARLEAKLDRLLEELEKKK